MKVVVQILLYNESFETIDRLLTSLEQIDFPAEDWALVIINNRCAGFEIEKHFNEHWRSKVGVTLPQTVLHAQENNGFAGGHVSAYEISKTFQSEFIYLLNGDAYVDPGCLLEVVKEAMTDENFAVVQSRIMLAQEPTLLNSSGNCLHFLGFGYTDGYRQTIDEARRSKRPHFYASGAGVLICTEAIEIVGGLFYPDLFMYHDDVDISWRARLAGLKIGYAEASVVYHHYEFSKSIKKFYWMERNRHLINLINYKIPTLLLIAPAAIVMELGTFGFSIKSGWWKEKLRCWAFFLKPSTWLMILRRRHHLRRTASDREMLALMVGTIEAQEVKNPIITFLVNPALSLYFRLLKLIVRW